MIKEEKILILMGMFLLIVGILSATILVKSETKRIDKKCYDKYGSEIKGLECEDEIYINEYVNNFEILLVFLGIIGLSIGIFILLVVLFIKITGVGE